MILNHRETINCQDLDSIDLQNYYLITLSACKTGITNRQTLNDEYIGLASTCLIQGANHAMQ